MHLTRLQHAPSMPTATSVDHRKRRQASRKIGQWSMRAFATEREREIPCRPLSFAAARRFAPLGGKNADSGACLHNNPTTHPPRAIRCRRPRPGITRLGSTRREPKIARDHFISPTAPCRESSLARREISWLQPADSQNFGPNPSRRTPSGCTFCRRLGDMSHAVGCSPRGANVLGDVSSS